MNVVNAKVAWADDRTGGALAAVWERIEALQDQVSDTPTLQREHRLHAVAIELIARCTDDQPYTAHFSPPLDELPVEADDIELVQKADFGNLHHGSKDTSGESIELDFAGSHDWSLQLKHSGPDLIEPDEVTDLVLIVGYEWE